MCLGGICSSASFTRHQDIIINFAGASIFSRWTDEQKKILRASRMNTTRHLVSALPEDARFITFFSTSAVGYYGFHEEEALRNIIQT